MDDQNVLYDKVMKGIASHNSRDAACDYCPYERQGQLCVCYLLKDIQAVFEAEKTDE